MHDTTVKLLSHLHTGAYRLTGGRVGRRLVGNDMLLLTTVGRRTGRPHTVPLLYLRDDSRLVVVASYGGRDDHPEWYRNLAIDPAVTVQVDGARTPMEASTMTTDERTSWWPRIVEAWGDYENYQRRTSRTIPVVWLDATKP